MPCDDLLIVGDRDLSDDAGDLALFYLDLIGQLKLDSVHIVGQCIGGWVALEMAIRSTARIKFLTLARKI